MVATIQLPLQRALDMQENDVVNSTNLISEWQAGDHITTYGTEGTVVYTDNSSFRLWRRNTAAFDPATDSQISPDTTEGAAYWTEIEVEGGNSPLEGWTINGTPDARTPVLHWDPAAGLEEWEPNRPEAYQVGDRFFTSTRPDFFPDPSTRGNIYEVIVTYIPDDTFDVRNVDNTVRLVESTNATALRWEQNGDNHIPHWDSSVVYEIGDVVTYRYAAGSILTLPDGTQIPPVATTSQLRYTGEVTGGTGISQEPLINNDPTVTGFDRSSRDWAIPTGLVATYNGATSFSFSSYAVHERQVFGALRDLIRPEGGSLPVPVVGDDWELESDAAITHWCPNTDFYRGNILLRAVETVDPDSDDVTGATGGIWVVARDFTSGDTCLLYTSPSPRDS